MAIEDTMAQLAHSQVTQCLPSLSDDLQGFQLIYSNDDINSAVGVLVAVVNNLVVYIPAVYRKGKIYSMDIMYIPELHQWLPLPGFFPNGPGSSAFYLPVYLRAS